MYCQRIFSLQEHELGVTQLVKVLGNAIPGSAHANLFFVHVDIHIVLLHLIVNLFVFQGLEFETANLFAGSIFAYIG